MTATTAEPCLVDTNFFLEATGAARRHHAAARRFLSREPAPVVSAQILREYLVVATRPIAGNGLGLPLSDALANVRSFRAFVRLAREERPVLPSLLALLEEVPCAGKRIHDANVVATAIAHRIGRLVTFNVGDFAGFRAHVRVDTP
jgi:predicted nucleic acid-binding protein